MPSRRRFLRACTIGLAATAGCVNVTDQSPTVTEQTPVDGELNDTEDPPERVGSERIRWETDVAYGADNRPTLADGRLVAGTANGVVALSVATGDVQWSRETKWPVQAPPCLVGSTLVAVSGRFGEQYTVHGLDPATGERRWTFESGGHRLRLLASEGGRLFVVTAPSADAGASASATEMLFALASDDGSIEWDIEVDIGGGQDALVADGTVYVSGPEGVVAVKGDGSRTWTRPVDSYQSETLVLAGDTLTFVSEQARRQPRVHGVDAATGEPRWTFDDDWRAFTTRVVDGRLFVGGEQLARLDPSTGTPTWTVDRPVARLRSGFGDNRWVDEWRTTLSDAPVVDGTLYVGGPDPTAVAVDNGTLEWRHESTLAVTSPVAVSRGNLLLHGSMDADDRNRHLICLDAATGAEQWTFAGRFRLTDPVVDTRRAYLAESRSGLLALAV